MSAEHKVAVIGCGYWGPNLVRNFSALSNCRVVRVCDGDEGRLRHMKSLYPDVDTDTDAARVLEDAEVEAVAVATPVRTHYDLARRCLEAGKHTFVEKPMAASVSECARLVSLARERGLVLMVGHTFLYSSPVRAIKEIVDSGELGNLLYISSRRLNLGLYQKDINVAWDLAPHDISIVLHVLGEPPVSVACQGKSGIAEGLEDVTNMTLTFGSGVVAMIQSSWLDPNKIREITFVGSRKMLVYDDVAPQEKIRIYDKRVEPPPHYDTYAEFHCSYHYGDILSPYIKQVEPLRVECQHFLDCIAEGKTPLSDGVRGMEVVEVLESATKSMRMGGGRIYLDGLVSSVIAPVAMTQKEPVEIPK
jgi:predicted dehydrogenase